VAAIVLIANIVLRTFMPCPFEVSVDRAPHPFARTGSFVTPPPPGLGAVTIH
jgi:hypothetical protein